MAADKGAIPELIARDIIPRHVVELTNAVLKSVIQ
jgi:hypothetical protein